MYIMPAHLLLVNVLTWRRICCPSFRVTGVKQLLEGVLNALDPNYALQLLTRTFLGLGSSKPQPAAVVGYGSSGVGKRKSSDAVEGSPAKRGRK